MSSLNTRIRNKKDTVANWEESNPVILNGELIAVITGTNTNNKELIRFKVGDGTSTYKELPFTDRELEDNIDDSLESISKQIIDINKVLDDLQYKAISITSFTNNVGTVEKGSTVTSVKLSWTLNKTPTSLTLDGTSIDVTLTSHTYDNLSLTSNKSYKLKATDNREATSEKSTSITFVNGVYYGSVPGNSTVDNSMILGLTRKLQGSKGITFTTNALEGEYIVFALPASYGTPLFNVGGFDGGFNLKSTMDFTNSSGYTESYNVYYSDNPSLGETTVKVS